MMPVFIYSSIKTAQSGTPSLAGGDIRHSTQSNFRVNDKTSKIHMYYLWGKKAFYTFGKLSRESGNDRDYIDVCVIRFY